MTLARFTFLTTLVALTAACSSGGSGTTPPPGDGPDGQFEEYGETIADVAVPADESLPTTGAASYSGVMGLNAAGPEVEFDIRGAMMIEVDFEDAAVTGQATRFVDADDRAYEGELAFSNGTLGVFPTNVESTVVPGMVVDFAGALESPDDGAIGFDSTFYAVFYNGATAFVGSGLNDTVTLEGGATSSASSIVQGVAD